MSRCYFSYSLQETQAHDIFYFIEKSVYELKTNTIRYRKKKIEYRCSFTEYEFAISQNVICVRVGLLFENHIW
jgi:hypothetical protein